MTTGRFDQFLSASRQQGESLLKGWGFNMTKSTPPRPQYSSTPSLSNSAISASKIYGSQHFGPVLTQWRPIDEVERTPSPNTKDELQHQKALTTIEKRIFSYLSKKDLLSLRGVNREHRSKLWRYVFVKTLLNAPKFEDSALPPMDHPFIPINYDEEQIKGDHIQRLPMMVLGICNRLKQITPQKMDHHSLMQGSFQIEAENEMTVYYHLIRCQLHQPGVSSNETVLIIFKCPYGHFVMDTSNRGIKSYHPHSPVRFDQVSDLFNDLFLSSKGCHGCEICIDEEGEISAVLTPIKMTLSSPKEADKTPTIQLAASLRPAISKAETEYRHDVIILRTALVAFSVFLAIQLSSKNDMSSYSIATSLLLGGLCWLNEIKRASSKLHQKAVKVFCEEAIPPSAVMKRIARKKGLIEELGGQLKTNTQKFNQPSEEGKTLLSYCESKELRKLLMQFGASPTEPHTQSYPLLDAVQVNDLARIEEFLTHQPHFTITKEQQKELTEESSTGALELLLKYRPTFDIQALNNEHTGRETAMRSLLKSICNEPINTQQDLQKKKWLINKVSHLIKCGADVGQPLVTIRAMKKLRDLHYSNASPKLMEFIGTSTQIAWKNAHALFDVWEPLEKLIQSKLPGASLHNESLKTSESGLR